jgi:hypothetical protein
MPSGKRAQAVGCALGALLSCWTDHAQAEPSADDQALATALFHEGRTLMSAGRTAEACPKLEESQRLDPSGGTLLNLALCHEQEGRLARAWSEFNDALALARVGGRRDRALAAEEHVRALAPRLSKLTIVVPAGAAADQLRVECDGRELRPGAWSTAMPVDGGEHVVRATAPGRESFTTTVVVGGESDAQTVEIPVLAAAAPPAAAAPAAAASQRAKPPAPVPPAEIVATAPAGPATPSVTPGRTPSVRRTLGYVLGGAGLGQLVVAGYFGWRAFDRNRTSDDLCPSDPSCTSRGASLSDDAGRAADVATVLTITGIATIAGGVYLLMTSPKRSASVPPAEPNLALDISKRGVMVGGRF